MNLVVLIGNLGCDPEVRHTTSNKAVASFSLATSERYKDKTTGEQKSITDWHNVVVYGSMAETAGKWLKKGSKISVQGKIKTRSYEAKDGQKKYVTEIIADLFVFLGEKPEVARQSIESSPGNYSAPPDNSTDDLPF